MPLSWNQQQPAANAANATWCPNCRSVVYPYKACTNCGLQLDWSQWQRAEKGAKTTETAKGMKAEKAATSVEEKTAGKKSLNIVSWVATMALAAVILLVLFVHLSPEYDMFLVKSESMVPAINMGDLIITGPVNGTVRPGTVVTYARGEALVTHRVISASGDTLVTKGDAVEDPDPGPVTMSQVRGIYLFKIPSLGYLANFMHTKFGWFIIVIVPTVLLLGLIFWEIVKEVLKKPQRRSYTESYIQRR
jgi:signal peptidase I